MYLYASANGGFVSPRSRYPWQVDIVVSDVQDADLIVVLHQGSVIEQGAHSDLLERGGVYARMWRLQQESASGGEAPSIDEMVHRMEAEGTLASPRGHVR